MGTCWMLRSARVFLSHDMVDATQRTFLLRFLQKIEMLVGLMHVS